MSDSDDRLSEAERAALDQAGFPDDPGPADDDSDGYECEHCGEEFDTLAAERGHECPEQRAAEARSAESEERPIVATQVHEIGAHLCFADDRDGLSPYFAVVSQWDEAMARKGEVLLEDVAGTDWILADEGTRYWSGGIAAEGESYDTYNEYQFRLVAADELAEQEARKIVFQVRPSLPDARTTDGDRIRSMPEDLPEGVRVQVNSDNVHPDDVLGILRATMGAIGVRKTYFLDGKLYLPSCNVYNAAEYVRIERPVSEQLITSENALLERLARFGSQRGGRGEHTWDHGEIMGHRETVAMDAETWNKLVDGREIGTLLKSYHMANPEKNTSGPTTHPKLEVQFSTEYSERDTVPWSADGYDRHDLLDELDENLVNALHWAGVNLDPDDPAYVDDAYFQAEAEPREVKLVDDPIEIVEEVEADLAASQFHAADLTEAELRAFRTAVEDGEQHYEQLAEASDTSKSTIYRMFEKVDGVLRRMNGRFSAGDDVIRERLEGLFDAIDRAAEWAERDLSEIVGERRGIPEDSPFSRWMQRYGVQIRQLPPEEKPTEGIAHEDWIELDVGLGQWSEAEIKRILREGGLAARDTSKRLLYELEHALVSYRNADRDGHRRQYPVANWMGNDFRVGGFSML